MLSSAYLDCVFLPRHHLKNNTLSLHHCTQILRIRATSSAHAPNQASSCFSLQEVQLGISEEDVNYLKVKFSNNTHVKWLLPLVLFNYFLIHGWNQKNLCPCFKKKKNQKQNTTFMICIHSHDSKQRFAFEQELGKIFPWFDPLLKLKFPHSQ